MHLYTPRPAGTTIKHVLPLFLPVSIFYLTRTKKYRLMHIKYTLPYIYPTYKDLFFYPAGKGQIRVIRANRERNYL